MERIKLSRTGIFKAPPADVVKDAKFSRKRPLVELNSLKEDSTSSEDEDALPINLERDGVKNKTQLKKQRKQVNFLADQMMESFALEKNSETPKRNEEKPIPHVATPIRKSKKSNRKSKLDEIDEVAEPNEMASEESAKSKGKRKKSKKSALLNDDDEEMQETTQLTERFKSKRIKFDDACGSESADEDVVDKLNESHHQKMRQHKTLDDRSISNYENSSKKKKKGKKKSAEDNNNDDDWKIQNANKKIEKYERKRLKYESKHKKLVKESKVDRKSKKKRRKEVKKKFVENAEKVISEMNSLL